MGSHRRPLVLLSTTDVKAAETLPLSSFAFYIRHGYGTYDIVAAMLCCRKKDVASMVRRGSLKVVRGPRNRYYIPLMQLAEYFDIDGMLDKAPLIEKLRVADQLARKRLEMLKLKGTADRDGGLSKVMIARLKTPSAQEAEEIMRSYEQS